MKKAVLLTLVLTLIIAVGQVKADFTFGEPENLGPTVNSAYRDKDPFISIDRLSLYFSSNRLDTSGERDIWVTTRATTEDDWGTPVNLGSPFNGELFDSCPCISADGMEFYFMSRFHPNGFGYDDIWVSRRQSKDDPWGDPVNLGSSINTWASEYFPRLTANGLELYFNSTGHGGFGKNDIFVSRRVTVTDEWGPPINLGSPVNSQYAEISPSISADGLCLFFADHHAGPYRVGGHGGGDIWITTLQASERNPEGYWCEPQNLGAIINSSYIDGSPYVSADGSVLFFHSNRPDGFGDGDIYQAPIIPVVDLNSDGIVDAADMCIVVDNWGTDNEMCDVGPMPWGDGVVDVEDLKVLAEHLFEVYPSADTIDVTKADNGSQIELEQNKLLVVTLESNSSTGYQWELGENNESILKQFGQKEYKPPETSNPRVVGAGGSEIFRFKAIGVGQTTLKLVYHKPWEEVEPLETFSIQVTVNE